MAILQVYNILLKSQKNNSKNNIFEPDIAKSNQWVSCIDTKELFDLTFLGYLGYWNSDTHR